MAWVMSLYAICNKELLNINNLMDKATINKKNLRAHRRTVSSNLQDLCTKLQTKDSKNVKSIPVEPIEKEDYLIKESKTYKIPFSFQENHQVVKLVKASSELALDKKVIIDNLFESEQQQKINRPKKVFAPIQSKSAFNSPRKFLMKQNDLFSYDTKSFKKKPRVQSKEHNKQTLKKSVGFKKVIQNRNMKSEYFDFQPSFKPKQQNKYL